VKDGKVRVAGAALPRRFKAQTRSALRYSVSIARHVRGNWFTISRMRISARNHLVGKITELQLGDIMAHVTVEVGSHIVESVITRRSAEEMNLKVGDTVAAVIKSTEVMLQKA